MVFSFNVSPAFPRSFCHFAGVLQRQSQFHSAAGDRAADAAGAGDRLHQRFGKFRGEVFSDFFQHRLGAVILAGALQRLVPDGLRCLS